MLTSILAEAEKRKIRIVYVSTRTLLGKAVGKRRASALCVLDDSGCEQDLRRMWEKYREARETYEMFCADRLYADYTWASVASREVIEEADVEHKEECWEEYNPEDVEYFEETDDEEEQAVERLHEQYNAQQPIVVDEEQADQELVASVLEKKPFKLNPNAKPFSL